MRARVLTPLALVTFGILVGSAALIRGAQAPSGTKSFDPTTYGLINVVKGEQIRARERQPARETPNAER